VQTFRPTAAESALLAQSRDQLPPDSPGALCAHRRHLGGVDLPVDLGTVIAVVTDGRGDAPDIDGERLGSGDEGSRAALIDLAEKLDNLPDIRPVSRR
jgi:hypothetical protein